MATATFRQSTGARTLNACLDRRHTLQRRDAPARPVRRVRRITSRKASSIRRGGLVCFTTSMDVCVINCVLAKSQESPLAKRNRDNESNVSSRTLFAADIVMKCGRGSARDSDERRMVEPPLPAPATFGRRSIEVFSVTDILH